MTLQQFNKLTEHEAKEELLKCCGSSNWSAKLASFIPFNSVDDLLAASDKIWSQVSENDVLEAFQHHPKIGDLKSLEKKFASTKEWASGEQAAVNAASKSMIESLASGNEKYEKKFGFIFVVCATGKSAQEMLELLVHRLPNNRSDEIKIAAAEQNKITHIRITKLFS